MAPAPCFNNLFLLFLCLAFLHITITAGAPSDWKGKKHIKATQNWLNHGGDLYNRRYADKETKISPATASKLRLKWKFYAGKDITATPAIFNGTLYFPSWNGYIYAVKALDGSLVWKKNLQRLTGLNATGLVSNINWTVSRSTPTVADDLLIIGIYGPAVVVAVKRSTGKLVWSTWLDRHVAGVVTMSGTFHKGAFYIGTSSLEEGASIQQCCTFRGSFSKLDVRTGAILWQTFMLPNNHGKTGQYAGAAVWGSSPSIDVPRSLVYIATGNLYSAPEHVLQCQEKENNQTIPTQLDQCVEPDNHSDSILALDLESGKIKWYKQLGGYDVWFVACNNLSTPNCPPGPNPDADFGEAPMMLSVYVNGTKQDMVAAVQKSGFAWALDRDNGSLIWSTEAGPGGTSGGGIWGAATDEKRVYTNIANSGRQNFTLKPSTKTTTAGAWVAMDARTGEILWSTANPSNATSSGPVTVANGVLFAGSTSPQGPVYAMSAKTGKILWSYETGATVYGGVSVSNGCIHVGSGYKATPNVSVSNGCTICIPYIVLKWLSKMLLNTI
ncbi:hypothetical protein L1049_003197 [Liquidambar formosana]|uniref:Pyrrolo-quinoline quinone repeat domain-containing protein n=1 Tax=Liquidambar formosana TaxID=63359 RepID=A0AAP0R8N6_LIQFO